MLTLLALPLLALAADPAPRAAAFARADAAAQDEPDDDGWRLVDRVELIVNDDIITLGELDRTLRRAMQRFAVSTQRELDQLRQRVKVDAARERLMTQGGRALGLDPSAVDRVVDRWWEGQVEDSGGVVNLSERLRKDERSTVQRREEITGEIYRSQWYRATTGIDVGAGGRLVADRYVRPGLLRLRYDRILRSGSRLDAIGGRSETWVFQRLIVDPRSAGGLDAARELALSLRSLALDGADFDELLRQHGALQADRGMTPALAANDLRRHGLEFAFDAEVGAISPPLPVQGDGQTVAWQILKVIERNEPVVPDFERLAVQQDLREGIQGELDAMHEGAAIRELLSSAYLWNPGEVDLVHLVRSEASGAARDEAEPAGTPLEGPPAPEGAEEGAPAEEGGAGAEPAPGDDAPADSR